MMISLRSVRTSMIHHYLVRGYPRRELMNDFKRANSYTHEEDLNGKPIDTSLTQWNKRDKPILITQFHPDNPDLRKIINKHWNIIEYSRDCGHLFQKPTTPKPQNPKTPSKLKNIAIFYFKRV